MASFDVRISAEILAGGCRLVKRGPEKSTPEIELEAETDWRSAVEQFCVRTLGDLPRHQELAEVETEKDGLFPVLKLNVRCYLAEMMPPLDDGYRWARQDSTGPGGVAQPTGGALDPAAEVRLFTDGGSRGNPGPAGTGVLLVQEHSGWSEDFSRFIGRATNNKAEYEALLDGLRLALQRGVRKLEHRTDSQLLVRQLEGAYKVKSPELRILFDQAKALISSFESFRTVHVPREQNRRADELANRAMDGAEANDQ